MGNLILGKFARDHLHYSTLPYWVVFWEEPPSIHLP
jgi:hypothetical protein